MFKEFKRKQASKKIERFNLINEKVLQNLESGNFSIEGWLSGYEKSYKIWAEIDGADQEELQRHQEFGWYVAYRVESFVDKWREETRKPSLENRVEELEKEIKMLKKQLTK